MQPPPPPPERFTLTVLTAGEGKGTISLDGSDCTVPCEAMFDEGQQVTVVAQPIEPSTFGDWSAPCTDSGPDCTLTVEASLTLTASSTRRRLRRRRRHHRRSSTRLPATPCA